MDGGTRYEFDAELWRWEARQDEWVFLTLPQAASEEIADVPRPRVGFGAVRVTATIGSSRWTTSVFPDPGGGGAGGGGAGSGWAYVLPVKRAVRTREGVGVGDVVRAAVETLD